MCTSTAARNLLHTENCNILVGELQREEPLLCHCQQVYSAQRPLQQPPKTEDKNNREEEPETSPTWQTSFKFHNIEKSSWAFHNPKTKIQNNPLHKTTTAGSKSNLNNPEIPNPSVSQVCHQQFSNPKPLQNDNNNNKSNNSPDNLENKQSRRQNTEVTTVARMLLLAPHLHSSDSIKRPSKFSLNSSKTQYTIKQENPKKLNNTKHSESCSSSHWKACDKHSHAPFFLSFFLSFLLLLLLLLVLLLLLLLLSIVILFLLLLLLPLDWNPNPKASSKP